jgi:RHS repeat-associated protein
MDNNKMRYKNLILFFVALVYTAAGYTQPRQLPSPYLVMNPVNYVRTWDAVMPETVPNNITNSATPDKFILSTQYIDGLGRPLEGVVKQGSLDTKNNINVDMISPVLYDEFGREQFKYLPFASTATDATKADGSFKLNPFQQQATFYSDNTNGPVKNQAETYYYAQTQFEPLPLGRVTKTLPPGNNWIGTNRGSDQKYWYNTPADAVRIWNVTNSSTLGTFGSYASTATYGAGLLYKNVTVDENGKQVIEFKDKEGKVILKKVQLTATADAGTGRDHTGWLCTYYIYDDLNNLRCVIQPRGVELLPGLSWVLTDATILAEQCFRYEYDSRNRMIVKKVPGAGQVNMVYDARDRLMMTQDANLSAQTKWLVTLYDALNRPVQTGLLLNSYNNKTFAQHLAAAAISSAYPFTETTTPSTTYWEKLTVTHYDNYTGVPSPLTATLNITYVTSPNFIITGFNTSPYYAQQVAMSTQVNGMVTWSQVKVLGTTSQFISQVNFYDDKRRVIQTQTVNLTGGVDIATTQYDFSGKVLRNHLFHQKAGGTVQSYQIATKNTYDILGRTIKIEKNFNNAGFKVISAMEYDALGQLKKKSLGAAPLETLAYDYNIRGWLLGENRDYAKSTSAATNYFGFDLGYDKNTIAPAGGSSIGTYATPAFNGNIEGMVWKSKGDGEIRKYDFNYDAVNRLMKADFNQYTSGAFNKTANVDFSVKMGDGATASTAYDANGNIQRMQQWGLKIGSSGQIDDLTYHYTDKTNKLLNIADADNDNQTTLGDFRVSALNPVQTKTTTTVDYTYDANGNLLKDLNKDIGTVSTNGIVYNYLNLPQTITVQKSGGTKGTITYTYDATGNKLKKAVIDYSTAGKTVTTTTNYIAGFVYESKTTVPVDAANPDYSDVLQFTSHEEGRIRRKTDGTFAYDYFLKDHLGNVRMLLTEDVQQDIYPAATLENVTYNGGTAVNVEDDYYSVTAANVVAQSTATGIPVYQNNNGIPNNNPYSNTAANSARLYKLDATTNTVPNKTGLGIVLKVMAGDNINIFGKSYHKMPTGGYTTTPNALTVSDIITLFTGTPLVSGKGITPTQITGQSGFPATVTALLNNQPAQTSSTPRAGINWVILDEQFKWVSGGFDMVGTAAGTTGTFKSHAVTGIAIPKNGYIYIYCSNESKYSVFFDNLQVVHNRGAILEETHYYPGGLVMAGISSKAANITLNKIKFNGKEEQRQEFSDGSGLEWTDFGARMYDNQLMRWATIDPLAQKRYWATPYNYVQNNPINRIDPNGLTDYTLDKKTGDIKQVGEKNDDPDRILKTNRIGKVKYKKNREAKVAMDGIEKGILKDGINFQKNDNVISVGGKGQASVDGVKSFTLKLSEYVGKEIAGFSYSADGSKTVTDMVLGKYVDNKVDESHADARELAKKYGSNYSTNNILQDFHTHPNGELGATQSAPQLSTDVQTLQGQKPIIPNASFIILYRIAGQEQPAEYDYTHEYIPPKK